jgi:hypothetical protein
VEHYLQPVVYTAPTGAKLLKLLSGEDASDALGPHVINQSYRLRLLDINQAATSTVVNFGISHYKGEWFKFQYEDTSQITREEMEEILHRTMASFVH